jgi:hypothetical protein
MTAIAGDNFYSPDWRDWILRTRLRLGAHEFADMIYYRSEFFVQERRRTTGRNDYQPGAPILFGLREGRIAKANRGKDPLYLFAALQRQLGYPSVPRQKSASDEPQLPPAVEQRLLRLEKRIQILEGESKGKLDLSEFYAKPVEFQDPEQGNGSLGL